MPQQQPIIPANAVLVLIILYMKNSLFSPILYENVANGLISGVKYPFI